MSDIQLQVEKIKARIEAIETSRIDEKTANEWVRKLYEEINEKPDIPIFWYDSPMPMVTGAIMHDLYLKMLADLPPEELAELKAKAAMAWAARTPCTL
jgi:hypothetical protein